MSKSKKEAAGTEAKKGTVERNGEVEKKAADEAAEPEKDGNEEVETGAESQSDDTAEPAQAEGETGDEGDSPSYLNAKQGLLSWLFTLDHKRIGIMYLVAIVLFLFVGGALALAFRLELLTPKSDLMGLDTYNKVFTLHGAIMVFLFIIPSIPAALGNFFLPLMLGAKDMAFPRLNLLSFWIYVVGALFFLYTVAFGSLDTGWTFYTPYSTQSGTAVISATLGAFILGFSSILTSVNFIVTTHKMRAPGLKWNRLPLFVWASYATSIIQLLSTPVLGITLVLLAIERVLGIGIFDPAKGGDPILYQHFFWFYSHPAVYIMILPAFGIQSEIITIHSRKNIFGYSAIAVSSVAIAAIGFLVWGHHMFVSGQSGIASAIFSVLTYLVAIPTAIKVFSWVATLWRGSIRFTAPMVYALTFIFIFSIGGLTGIFLGTLSVNVHLHDTYFVVAHFHYVMMGGTGIAFIAGIHHWWPKMTGRMYDQVKARWAAVAVFVGMNITFFAQFIMGSRGMPRRYATYPAEYQLYHVISTIGALMMAAALAYTVYLLLHSLWKGKKAPDNPWDGVSLEWKTQSPPIEHNFEGQPVVRGGPYDFEEIEDEGPGQQTAEEG